MNWFVQIAMAFIGSLGFSVLFHIKGIKLIVSGFGGAISWLVYLLAARFLTSSEVICYFLAAIAVTVYAEICARIIKTPTTTFLVSGIIPMIPGGLLYYTMNYALKSSWELFFKTGAYTVELALALAVGIIVVSSVMRMFTAVFFYLKKIKK